MISMHSNTSHCDDIELKCLSSQMLIYNISIHLWTHFHSLYCQTKYYDYAIIYTLWSNIFGFTCNNNNKNE